MSEIFSNFALMNRYSNPSFEGLDLQYWHDLIESRGELVSLKRGEYLSRKGEPNKTFGYVKSGYLIYKIDGMHKPTAIGGFVFAGALWGNYPNCMYDEDAMYDIVAGKKTEVWMMDATVLPQLYKEDSYACQQGRIYMEAMFKSLVQSYRSLCSKTPMQRYLDLIHSYSYIEQDLPQKEIAEYLQIDPITLCRIKKALLKQ